MHAAKVSPMEPLVAGFWGAAFGTAGLMLAGAAVAYGASLRRMGLMAAVGAVMYPAFAASYLKLLPGLRDATHLRVEATMFMLCAVLLGHLVLAMIGILRQPVAARRWPVGV